VTVTRGTAAPPGAAARPVEGTGAAFAGFATRLLAFAADAVVIDVVAAFVALVVAAALSIIDTPQALDKLVAIAGAGLAVIWMISYFVFFWSADGQTPGSRMMRIRVQDAATGGPLRARRALLRVLLLPISALPLFAGFLMILVDRRRRALHDWFVHSVVVYAPDLRRRIR
jgi:uncharacterized RDD family membrane protein YckC